MGSKDVQVCNIALDTRIFRSRTWERLKFEVEYGLSRGTTANSFLIEADKTALIDPPGESFTEIFLSALSARIDLKKIDYVILGHINPNRAFTLNRLIQLAPQITFIVSNTGAKSLREIFENSYRETVKDYSLNIISIKNDYQLNLGKEHQLDFITTPNPRYPDQLLTFDKKTDIFYTDKLFGSHVCGDQIFDEGWQVYFEDRRYYFDCVIAPYSNQVSKALEKIKPFSALVYAPSHGPLVKYGLHELTGLYSQWLSAQQNQTLNVALVYASAYGNTAILANAIARGVTKAGVRVESINAEFADSGEIKEAIATCDGFIFGSPTLGGHAPTQIQSALGVALATADRNKIVGVFGSYGWSGEAIDLLESKFKDGGYRFGFDTIRVKFKPTEAILKTCEEAGTDFAQALKKRKKALKSKESAASNTLTARTEQALGRIIGSLSIVTTQREELKGAMVASWVSQATFTPPGLTIAVAKERAIESLLPIGSHFVLNILEEGKHIDLMKHFLKPFAPGEDRFVNINWETADNGSPILTDALAYLECEVKNRLECGDHWVLYAIATQGKLLSETGITAIHHRKSGTHY
ncbi:diflavin flavoprotein [Cyanobacterium aponinum UTEX 3222]|uniref:diflavin flavoprotein n=1 Tax=Cyanobacterium aponinum TaxID=379064 RepID=UPI002B4BE431|nr:diflavin flavoprotein [Cyanobacterium aponinum]WRL37024.1 diflavin flavoprotein [Cyanobacterium aponinum UTEX 3221]WRL43358.1 diflavin flavoprotein [Cyanobacterium aponinum UTEX 3222]